MTSNSVRSRTLAVGIAGLLALTASLSAGLVGRPGVVRAADAVPSFALPSDAELATDAAAAIDDAPPAAPTQVDPNPVLEGLAAILDTLPPEVWEVGALAATLGTDPDLAFALVRDSIRFDPYAGVLRGAQGTLSARAGNAFDRALLLKALLDAMGLKTRLALADLDAAAAAAIVAHAFDPVAVPLPVTTTTGLRGGAGAALAVRAARDYALLRGALADRIGTMSADAAGEALADTLRHAWVQVEREGRWVDYDPTMPDAAPGAVLAPAAETVDQVPTADRQTVTVRVVAETLEADGVYETVTLEQVLDAADAADREILLYFQPDPETTDGGMLGGFGGLRTLVPILSVGDAKTIGAAFPIGDASEDDGFGGLGGGGTSGSLLSLRVEMASEAPGTPESVSRRILIDRVPREVRASGSVVVGQLLPVAYAGIVPVLLTNVHHVMVSTGGSDPRAQTLRLGSAAVFASRELALHRARTKFGTGAILSPMTAADRDLVLASERAIVPGLEAEAGARAFIARARVYMVSIGPDEADWNHVSIRVDLALDSVRVMAAPGTDPGTTALRQVWYGALQTALETEFVRRAATTIEPATLRFVGASLNMGQPLTVLAASDVASLPAGVAAPLRRALELEQLVIVPGEPVDAIAWWTVDPTDGTTRSILDPGGRSLMAAGALINPGGYVVGSPTVMVHWTAYEEAAAPRGGLESQAVTNLVAIESIATTEQIVTLFVELMKRVIVYVSLP